jgi:hypothetical protein
MEPWMREAIEALIAELDTHCKERRARWVPPERDPADIEGRVHDALQFRGSMPTGVRIEIAGVRAAIIGLEALRLAAETGSAEPLGRVKELVLDKMEQAIG